MTLQSSVFVVCFALGGVACKEEEEPPPRPPPGPCTEAAALESLKINQLQVVTSHNSYRRRMFPPLFAFISQLGPLLPPDLNLDSLDYEHIPLVEQLDGYGIRGVELDLFHDPAGGLFFNRMGLSFIGMPTASNIPELNDPGFKVLHVPDVDYETHHYTFRSALQTLKTWSDAHPAHLPLFVHVEAKEGGLADALPNMGLTVTLPYDAAAADAIDAEIRGVFTDAARLITPDEVRGTNTTLEEGVLAGGWPTLAASRGRVLFYMEGGATEEYLAPSAVLAGRVMFVKSDPGQPHAAVVFFEQALGGDGATISNLVNQGYIIRVRADSSTIEARSGDGTRRDAAFASGAQLITTDYYRPDPRAGQAGWTNYDVYLPGGPPSRINPVNGGGATSRICE